MARAGPLLCLSLAYAGGGGVRSGRRPRSVGADLVKRARPPLLLGSGSFVLGGTYRVTEAAVVWPLGQPLTKEQQTCRSQRRRHPEPPLIRERPSALPRIAVAGEDHHARRFFASQRRVDPRVARMAVPAISGRASGRLMSRIMSRPAPRNKRLVLSAVGAGRNRQPHDTGRSRHPHLG